MIIAILFVAPAVAWFALAFRITAFRNDRQGPEVRFANPFDGLMLPVEILSANLYNERGRRLLPWLRLLLAVLVCSWIVGLGLLARG